MSVNRYSVGYKDSASGRYAAMLDKQDGGYVSHDDYAALEQRLIESERYGRQTDITIDNLEMNLAQMAAENAGLKAALNPEVIPDAAVEAFTETAIMDHDWNETSEWSWVENDTDVIRAVLEAIKPETPSTDVFLAEVRAQGVEAAIATAKNVVAQEFQYKDFETAQRVCSKFPESDLVGKVEMVEWLEDFATQLRKGVQL
ncbi:hNH endonuclease [Enterobacter ludwigii]|uniref:hNH endonuclease n=1 Tax=Enterobacter ludwigii TaxID=299767 RepID=UPI002FFA4A86